MSSKDNWQEIMKLRFQTAKIVPQLPSLLALLRFQFKACHISPVIAFDSIYVRCLGQFLLGTTTNQTKVGEGLSSKENRTNKQKKWLSWEIALKMKHWSSAHALLVCENFMEQCKTANPEGQDFMIAASAILFHVHGAAPPCQHVRKL